MMHALRCATLDDDHAAAPAGALGLLIGRIGHEVATLAEQVSLLQDTLDLCETPAVAGETVEAVQSLDLIDQTLRSLAQILARTGEGMGEGPFDLARVLQGCTLSDLSCRLAGLPVATRADDLELF